MSTLFRGVVTCAAAVGDLLYVAGRFSNVGDVPTSNIAQFDGQTWAPLGTGLVSRDVWSIASNDAGVFNPKPFILNPTPQTLNPKSGTHNSNPKSEIRNSKPETRNQKLETLNPKN